MPPESTRPSLPDVKHLLTAAGLVVGTLGTLLLGAAFQVDPRTVASEPPAVLPLPPVAGGSLGPAETERTPPRPAVERVAPAPPPAARPVLENRTEDTRRMLSTGDGWTLQFMVTCNEDSAARLLQETGDDPRLFMLPLTLNDRPCFRICWDTFRSRESALAHAGIPASLMAINAEPLARKVEDVVP